MAVIQIPNLAPAISLDGREIIECVQGGVTKRLNVAQIWAGGINYKGAVITTDTDYLVEVGDGAIICNGPGAIILTLPPPQVNYGVELKIKTLTSNYVTSAYPNVCPINSLVAGTSILTNSSGKWALLQSDGSNWIIMASN